MRGSVLRNWWRWNGSGFQADSLGTGRLSQGAQASRFDFAERAREVEG